MLKPKKVVWAVTFQGCDRSELFASVRGLPEKFRQDVIDTMSRIDDNDPDNINASAEVDNLDDLLLILNATKNVQCYFGRGVAVRSEFAAMTHYASLFSSVGQYEHSSASLSVHVVPQQQAALLEKLSEAELALQAIRDEVRSIGATDVVPR